MEKRKMPSERRLIFSSSATAPLPSPIPTSTGSRSAVSPIIAEQIDKAIRIPELVLPQRFPSRKPEEINYESLLLRENDSVRGLLRSAREFGVFRIVDHGISTEELTFALETSERIFGLMVECCTSFGDHEKIIWRHYGDRFSEEAIALIGEHKFQIFCQKVEKVACQLETIAEELTKVIVRNSIKQLREPIQLGQSTMNMYRFHRANLIDRNSTVIGEIRSQESSGTYALSLHLLPESGEFCLEAGRRSLSFASRPDTVIVTIGKELEEWSLGEFKSAQKELMFKPFLHTSRPSFSIERKWSSLSLNLRNPVESNNTISLLDQILILLVATLLYKYFNY